MKIRYKINEKAIKILREKYCTENNKDRFILIHNKLIDNEKELKQLCNLYGLNIKLSSNVAKEVIKVCNKIDYNFYLDKEYLKYEIEKATSILGFEYSNKAGKSKISKVEIKIPFNVKTELPDKKIQSIIGIKYKKIDEYNKQLNEMLKEIKNIKVDL